MRLTTRGWKPILVIWQERDVEGQHRARQQGQGVGLLLAQQSILVRLKDVQVERGGEAVGHDEGQVLQPLQLTDLLMTDL